MASLFTPSMPPLHEDADFDDIARQFVLMERHARDARTGLLYHGWDESRQQRWLIRPPGVHQTFGAEQWLVWDGARRTRWIIFRKDIHNEMS